MPAGPLYWPIGMRRRTPVTCVTMIHTWMLRHVDTSSVLISKRTHATHKGHTHKIHTCIHTHTHTQIQANTHTHTLATDTYLRRTSHAEPRPAVHGCRKRGWGGRGVRN